MVGDGGACIGLARVDDSVGGGGARGSASSSDDAGKGAQCHTHSAHAIGTCNRQGREFEAAYAMWMWQEACIVVGL